MAKFDTSRMGDSTVVGRVDNQHNAMEEAVEDVFGIPDNTEITAYIFGENPEATGDRPIQPDGSIRGVPVLKSSGAQSDPASAVGFKWDDGVAKKLLVFVDSLLQLYEDDDYPNESWSLVMNLEEPGSGQLVNLTDYTETAALADRIGYLLKVNAAGNGFDLQAPSGGTGVTTFIALTDTPVGYGTTGQILAVAAGGTSLEWIDVPTAASPFIMLAEAEAASSWGSSQNWGDVYNWSLIDPGTSGYLITDESTYLANDTAPDPDQANKFFKNLVAGVYEISVWYVTAVGAERVAGIRGFRVFATSSLYGPAVEGVAHRATVGFNADGTLGAIDGAKFLGSKMFITKITTTDLRVQVFQDSGGSISGTDLYFYALIRKID